MSIEEGLETVNETVETTTVDNSEHSEETDLDKQISEALAEPIEEVETKKEAEDVPVTTEEKKDNTEKCPTKFQNEDGTVNVDNLLKSYKELEPLLNEKSTWQKERAELLKVKEEYDNINKAKETKAKEAGYKSAEDMQFVYDLAYTEANEYAKYLEYTEDPEEVRDLLIRYANNPSEELMEQIELEFAPAINKRVGVVSDRFKQGYETRLQEAQETAKYASIENVVKQSVEANKEIFDYEPFKNLFINTLEKYGNNFTTDDAKALINTMVEMKSLFMAEFEKNQGTTVKNNADKDNISAIAPTNSAPSVERYSNEDINKMSPEELNKAIRKFI